MAFRNGLLSVGGQALILALGLLSAVACASTREDDPEQSQGRPNGDTGSPSDEMRDAEDEPDASSSVKAPSTGSPDGEVPEPSHDDRPVVENDAGRTATDAAIDDASNPDAVPLALSACPEEDAAVCPASDPLCYWESGPSGGGSDGQGSFYSLFTGWSVCTRFCETDTDCASELGVARCIESGSDRICLFECTFGRSCPGELSCSNGDRCAIHFCECTGMGCDDPLCNPE